MNQISSLALNSIGLIKGEILEQLNNVEDPRMNVYDKELYIEKVFDDAVSIAKTSPNGEVTVAFSEKPYHKDASVDSLLRNTKFKFSFFNTKNKDTHLFHTVIIIDSRWSDNLTVLRKSWTLTDDFYKEL